MFVRKSAEMDIVDLVTRNEREQIGVLSLNYYARPPGAEGVVDSQGYRYPSWSPMARYGRQVNVSHAFAEYWHVAPGDRFQEREIRQQLLRIASAISRHKGFEGRVKVEADTEWREEMGLHHDGFHVMWNGVTDPERDPRTSTPRLRQYVMTAVKENREDDLRALGSFHIHVDADEAIAARDRFSCNVGGARIAR